MVGPGFNGIDLIDKLFIYHTSDLCVACDVFAKLISRMNADVGKSGPLNSMSYLKMVRRTFREQISSIISPVINSKHKALIFFRTGL